MCTQTHIFSWELDSGHLQERQGPHAPLQDSEGALSLSVEKGSFCSQGQTQTRALGSVGTQTRQVGGSDSKRPWGPLTLQRPECPLLTPS